MSISHYETFDLLFEPSVGGYRVRLLTSPVGQATHLAVLPMGPQTTSGPLHLPDQLLSAFPFPHLDQGQCVTPPAIQSFGDQLFQTFLGGEIGVSLRRSLDLVRQQDGGLRIRLRLDEAPELAAWPWEYLFDRTTNRYLTLSNAISLVRYLALPYGEAPLPVASPLRLLVMVADPTDVLPRLDVAHEQARLQEALRDVVARGNIEITWLEEATLSALQSTLRHGPYHLFHFVGHGWLDAATQNAGLLLENSQGKGERVAATRLGMLLHNHPTLRFAFLNACEGARFIEGHPFTGVAQYLVQQGLPAVIAMQFPVSDEMAILLAHTFYGALADQYTVDGALTEARLALYGQNSVTEWGTPVLFMRTPDGSLWQTEQEEAMSKENSDAPGIDLSGFTTGGNARDIVIGVVGAGAKNAVIGQGNRQIINEADAPRADDQEALDQHFARLFALLNSPTIDPRTAGRAESNLETLQAELTKSATEIPSAASIIRIGDWLLANVPELTQAVTELFGLPAVAKVLGKAGEAAVQWWRKRFGQ
ncbi:MAG: CHAT domain-containing protein [Caldilineaceae bacterium]